MGAVAVAGEDQQAGVFGGGDHLPFNVPGALEPGTRTAQPLGRGPEQVLGGLGSDVLDPAAGVSLRVAAAEQARVGAVRRRGDVLGCDVQQYQVGAGGRQRAPACARRRCRTARCPRRSR